MFKITIECETITPMFCYGADGETPALRAPSIKGAIRFWWRAVKFCSTINELREKEAEIFGGSGEGQGKSKVVIRIVNKDNKEAKSVWSEISFMEKTSHRGKKYKIPTEHSGLTYLFYSLMMQNDKLAIFPDNKFNITFLAYDQNALKHTIAAFWLLSYFGGIGSRARRGGGNFRIINVNDDNGIVKDAGLNFVLSGVSQKEIAQKILENFKIAKNLINEREKTKFISEYSNLSISRFIISNQSFKNWKDALNDIGKKFADFRSNHKSDIFEVAAFGFPILHRNKTIVVAGNIDNNNRKKIKNEIQRRSSPLIVKIIKVNNNEYYWLLLRMSGSLIPNNKILILKSTDKNTKNDVINKQKPDFSLFEEFWNIVKQDGAEHILSLPEELINIKQKIKSELNPKKIILFGSRARGDFYEKSDIDIAVETDNFIELSDINGNIDLIKLNNADNGLKEKILKEGFEI